MFTVDDIKDLTQSHIAKLVKDEHECDKNIISYNVNKLKSDSWWADSVEVLVLDLTCGGDYSGCAVHRANYELMEEFFVGSVSYVYELHGSYGYYGIMIEIDPFLSALNGDDGGDEVALELWDILCGLENYPVINEEYLSSVEERLIEEAWIDQREEFQDTLDEKNLIPSAEEVYVQFYENDRPWIEEGCLVSFHFDKMLELAKEMSELGYTECRCCNETIIDQAYCDECHENRCFESNDDCVKRYPELESK